MVRIAVLEDEAVSRQLLADYIARYSEENNVPLRSPISRMAEPSRLSSPVTTFSGRTRVTSSTSPTCAASPTRSAS